MRVTRSFLSASCSLFLAFSAHAFDPLCECGGSIDYDEFQCLLVSAGVPHDIDIW